MIDEIAGVLDQVVDLGPTPREQQLGAAVKDHVTGRPEPRREPDEDTAAALRALADAATQATPEASSVPCVSVVVDFNQLLRAAGQPEVWSILSRLKDLFATPGATPT